MKPRHQGEYSVADWDQQYTDGMSRQKWDLDWPGPDLVAATAVLGLGAGSAIDLGCGGGAESLYLASRGLAVLGVDVSMAALAIARARGRKSAVRATFCQSSVFDLPVQTSSVDFANDRGCLHSLHLDDWARYACELARVLKPGALALIRGCNDRSQTAFTALTKDRVAAAFGGGRFSVRAAARLNLCASRGHLSAALILLERRPPDRSSTPAIAGTQGSSECSQGTRI